jgi:hypothetical protein
MTDLGHSLVARPNLGRSDLVTAPVGYRWATGAGSPIGGCNGYHLARSDIRGTICGRYGPHTPPDLPHGTPICGNCARIAKVPRVAVRAHEHGASEEVL